MRAHRIGARNCSYSAFGRKVKGLYLPVLMALPRCLNSLFASPVVTRTTRDSLCWRTPKLMRLSRLGALGGVPSAMASEFEIDESTRALGGQMLRRTNSSEVSAR